MLRFVLLLCVETMISLFKIFLDVLKIRRVFVVQQVVFVFDAFLRLVRIVCRELSVKKCRGRKMKITGD